MTTEEVAKFLVEDSEDKSSSKKVSVFVNRLMLRLFSIPQYMSALVDVDVNDGESGGSVVQLDFERLPDEVVEPLIRLISAPSKAKILQYVKGGSARTGIEFDVKDSDLKGEEYDYAAS